jgi:hypothetical protein
MLVSMPSSAVSLHAMKNSTEEFSCKSDFFYARLNIEQHETSLIDL